MERLFLCIINYIIEYRRREIFVEYKRGISSIVENFDQFNGVDVLWILSRTF